MVGQKYKDYKNDDRVNLKIKKYYKGKIINPKYKKKIYYT